MKKIVVKFAIVWKFLKSFTKLARSNFYSNPVFTQNWIKVIVHTHVLVLITGVHSNDIIVCNMLLSREIFWWKYKNISCRKNCESTVSVDGLGGAKRL